MNYLYGDSAPSSLKSNFLEFLRDAIDFAVFTLEADARIRRGREHMDALRREAEAESERLRVFVAGITRAIDETPKGEAGKPTAECAGLLATRCGEALEAYLESVRAKLESDIAEAEAREAAERAACLKALGALLVLHEPPDAHSVLELELDTAGVYRAGGHGESSFGLAWRLDVAVPEAHFLAAPLRVDRLTPELGIRAPHLSGWISKEVKIKPQRLERHVVSAVAEDTQTLAFKLRADIGSPNGFDVELETAGPTVSIARLAPEEESKEPGATGGFEVDQEDAAKLLELGVKLRASMDGLERRGVVEATFDGEPFASLPSFRDMISRLVGMMTPIVREISERSLTPTELVLRRMLGNDRREEIFVTKASLREKYEALPEELRDFFTPLALDASPRPSKVDVPAPAPSIPTNRQELAPSRPPPPPDPDQAVAEVQIPPAAPLLVDPRKAREDFLAALKKNISLIREGKVDDGYRGFQSFFSNEAFASFRTEDQRQALGLMVLGKVPSPATDAIVDAHLSAITRLQHIIETSNNALDFEMLGLCHQVIEDTETAAKMYARALEIERANNPQSELLGRLMKRASSV